jgi:subtilase family serine protease
MKRFVAVVLAIGLGSAGLAVQTAGAAPPAARTPISGQRPGWATAAARTAATPDTETVPIRVYLKLRNQAAAEAQAAAVSDPDSPTYGKYLTPAQVRDAYAPTAAEVGQVSSWLSSQGLTVGYVPTNRAYVSATGSAAQVETAFATQLDEYQVRGTEVRAPSTDPSLPTSLSTVVEGVVGLDESARLVTPTHDGGRDDNASSTGGLRSATAAPATSPTASPSVGFRNAKPCSQYWSQQLATGLPAYGGGYASVLPWAPCGYTPAQLRSTYGLDGAVAYGADGRGVTVAVVDAFASPTIKKDITEYTKRYDPTHPWKPGQYRQIVPPGIYQVPDDDECDPSGWYGEQTLDIEAVHAMAPGANVLYVGGEDCEAGIDAALNHIVSRRLADIVSNSYGSTGEDIDPAEVRIFGAITLQGALEGIGLYFSSGDDGDESVNLDQPAVDFEPSLPWVTGVGGTSLGVAKNGQAQVEQGWETGFSSLEDGGYDPAAPGEFLYGSGGGASRRFSQPWYQRGVVPKSMSTQWSKAPARTVPDVAALGDPNTGMLIGQTQTFSDGVYFDVFRIGGTSLSSPLVAGMMAIADQVARHPHGFANPMLYRRSNRGAFRDIRPGPKQAVVRNSFVNGENDADGVATSVRTIDAQTGQVIRTAPGYDTITGLGVPNGISFLAALKR